MKTGHQCSSIWHSHNFYFWYFWSIIEVDYILLNTSGGREEWEASQKNLGRYYSTRGRKHRRSIRNDVHQIGLYLVLNLRLININSYYMKCNTVLPFWRLWPRKQTCHDSGEECQLTSWIIFNWKAERSASDE